MTEAERAYAYAEEEIARAKAEGWKRLELHVRETRALETLPSEIASLTGLEVLDLSGTQIRDTTQLTGLTALRTLFLGGTQISDAAPLANLTTLKWLSLGDTQISDLRPLRSLHKLVKVPEYGGLTFKDCAAARQDKRIAEIAEIEDPSERARTLFDYLEHWQPPGEAEEDAPAPDPLLPVLLLDGKLEIAASHPQGAELDDALKRALHIRLRAKAEALALAAGNRYPRLAARARGLADKLSVEFAALDMVQIHMDVEDLAAIYRRRGERSGEEAFTPDVVDALADVARDGPGLTLDNKDVELLEERKRRFAAQPLPDDLRAAHDRLSAGVADDPETFGPRLRALERGMAERADQPSKEAAQDAVHRNMLIRVGRLLLGGVKYGAGVAIGAYVSAHWSAFETVVTSYGPAFANWFNMTRAHAQQVAGLFTNIDLRSVPGMSDDEPD